MRCRDSDMVKLAKKSSQTTTAIAFSRRESSSLVHHWSCACSLVLIKSEFDPKIFMKLLCLKAVVEQLKWLSDYLRQRDIETWVP